MSEPNLQKVIEEINALNPGHLVELRRILDAKLQEAQSAHSSAFVPRIVGQSLNVPKDRSRESAWIEQHRDDYAGQWVALDGDKLLKHGASLQEVAAAAQQAGVSDALIMRVEPSDALPYMGI